MIVPALTLAAVFLFMLVEAQLSNHNERLLRAKGAVEPPDDVYGVMRWAYPACFLVMGIERAVSVPGSPLVLLAGLALLGAAKAFKFWAMASLGIRWSFRVLVLRGAPLVATGPYRYLKHPNYVAVCGEILAAALMLHARVTGPAALLGFGFLMWRRIILEERALADAAASSPTVTRARPS